MKVSDSRDNPRTIIYATNLERTLKYMELLEEEEHLDEEVRQTLLMLSDCLPAGTKSLFGKQ
jgi:hypothetical protein